MDAEVFKVPGGKVTRNGVDVKLEASPKAEIADGVIAHGSRDPPGWDIFTMRALLITPNKFKLHINVHKETII